MLKQRVLTATLLAPAAIASIVFLPLPIFITVITSLVLIGFWEWRKFINSDHAKTVFAINSIITLSSLYYFLPIPEIRSDFSLTTGANWIVLAGALWCLATAIMIKLYPKAVGWWENHALYQEIFGLLTLLPFLWSVFQLRAFYYSVDPYLGAKLVLLVCILVWAADTGAFFAGKTFGKHKMTPNVSPNKTMEGLAGGLVAAAVAMFIGVKSFSIPFTSFPMLILVAMLTSLASVIGDLAESMFKRVAGIKDSGRILPGHGGILDRIDSLTAAFPVFTVLYFGLVY